MQLWPDAALGGNQLNFIEGFLLAAGLLAALGPKDTFVIKNSLMGKNAVLIVAICSISDMLLIALGVAGLGKIMTVNRWLMVLSMIFSIAYLLYFTVQAIQSFFEKADQRQNFDPDTTNSTRQVAKQALFHSLLTPYAWLDTVLVIGSISATKIGAAKYFFTAGAMTASWFWFLFLTTGARLAAPLFRNRRTWKVLDLIVATSMAILAIMLALDYPWAIHS